MMMDLEVLKNKLDSIFAATETKCRCHSERVKVP